jgi:exodeoxyribonuclease VII small subunit
MGNSKRSAEGDKRGRGKTGKTSRSAKGKKTVKGEKAARNGSTEDARESTPPPSFESALERLEESVARLEEGEMPLEEALELFESGVKLSRQCQSTLESAERRVEILVADRSSKSGDENVIDFDSEEDADDEAAFED